MEATIAASSYNVKIFARHDTPPGRGKPQMQNDAKDERLGEAEGKIGTKKPLLMRGRRTLSIKISRPSDPVCGI